MSIFSRTRDIFAANITEMLDRSEDPAKMIRMVILEMEETLVEVRASAARCIADAKEMRRALSRLDELQTNWTEKAELALSKDREDLAKAALIERQKAADMSEGLRDEIRVIDDTLKGYEGDIAKLQGKLLLIEGEMDTNVDPASTMQVVNALIKAKKKFDLLVIPGAGHTNGGPYGDRLRYDFFVHHLLGVEPPDWNRVELKKREGVAAMDD